MSALANIRHCLSAMLLVHALPACGDEAADEEGMNLGAEPEPAMADDDVGPGGAEPEPGPAGEPDPGAEPEPGATGPVSFANDIVPIFQSSCGAATSGCHNRDAYYAAANEGCRGWLALEDEPLGKFGYVAGEVDGETGCDDISLYDRLTTLDAWMCGPPAVEGAEKWAYVVPGAPEESHLYNVIVGDPTGGGNCEKTPGEPATRMPLEPLPALSAAKAALIERWIAEGARNN